jgi:hypothetical protein
MRRVANDPNEKPYSRANLPPYFRPLLNGEVLRWLHLQSRISAQRISSDCLNRSICFRVNRLHLCDSVLSLCVELVHPLADPKYHSLDVCNCLDLLYAGDPKILVGFQTV